MATLSKRSGRLYASPLREILKLIRQPGMISFAGGLPSTDSFPDVSLEKVAASMLQYGESEGEPALRELIALELAGRGLDTSPERVIVLSGSQQGIDLAAKLFVDPGTPVAVESPTYLAALQVFDLFGADFRPFTPARPAQMLEHGSKPTLAYAIPTFQNPTGHCYDDRQRDALARLCENSGVTLFEDDPYRELVYDACERRPVCSRRRGGSWIYQSSFSKTLAPGLRLGYLTSTPDLFPYLSRLKQAADLHSARLSQHVLLQLAGTLRSPARMKSLRDAYRAKRDRFEEHLEDHFGGLATWDTPRGGLFFWLSLVGEAPIDTRKLLPKATEAGVAFMPGEPFFPGAPRPSGALRLNFSHADEDQANRGLATLAALLKGRPIAPKIPARVSSRKGQ